MGVTKRLAHLIAETTYQDLPTEAVLHGQMGLAQFSDASVQDPQAQALLQRVR